MKKKLFVYGTLQRGYGNNRLLHGQTFVGNGVTKKPYVLLNCGFPMAVPEVGGVEPLPVIGEVWEVDVQALDRCDSLEGHPDWYERKLIDVEVDGETLEGVYIYEMSKPRAYGSLRLCETENNQYKWSRTP